MAYEQLAKLAARWNIDSNPDPLAATSRSWTCSTRPPWSDTPLRLDGGRSRVIPAQRQVQPYSGEKQRNDQITTRRVLWEQLGLLLAGQRYLQIAYQLRTRRKQTWSRPSFSGVSQPDPPEPAVVARRAACRGSDPRVHLQDAGPAEDRHTSRTAARSLCNLSLRTASGPEGSSAKQILTCAAGSPGRGGTRQLLMADCRGQSATSLNRPFNQQSTISNQQFSRVQLPGPGAQMASTAV